MSSPNIKANGVENRNGRHDRVKGIGKRISAASAFFEALWDAGVTHCFVNLGSDHPAMIEAMVEAKEGNAKDFPRIITCPSEMVALSAALGFAQVTGVPQCVIVHVECGTLAMGQSIHNASVGRVPVLCFAGMSPFTQDGELLGSRTEFIHWLQDVPDQAAIIRQYCRYTAEIKTGHNIKQMVYRSLQFATSDPKGPVYLMAAREALEQFVEPLPQRYSTWGPLRPLPLPESAVEIIANALMGAKKPLVVSTYLGRNQRAPPLLAELCDKLPINVLETIGSDLCISSDHEAYLGVTIKTHDAVREADVILVMDCDVPWIPMEGGPPDDAMIFHLDVDPLKQQMILFHLPASHRYKVSCELALRQINSYLDNQHLDRLKYAAAFEARSKRYHAWRAALCSLETISPGDPITVSYLMSRLRKLLPPDTTIMIEAVTNALSVIHHLNLTKPGSLCGSGAGGLGWMGGAAIGAKLAKPESFICGIVGDGTFLFSQMESASWIASRYDLPSLIIVLNNSGWNAPKVSTLLVHNTGRASRANRTDLNLSFEPSPDYPGIAAAAGNAWGATIVSGEALDGTLEEAVRVVLNGRNAVVEVRIPSMWPET